MRILKRNLAFVMVLAMALGMMVTASAANVEDYKDANDITFVEAVDTLTALGILEGEDGTFNPQNTLTREQGAKIIAYLMLGKDGAESQLTKTAPFADVATGRWSAGFIAYCASQGIVGGYGNGNFGPNDTLTGTQFAKMLLVALGYGVNGEFTGPNWEIETNKTALVSGLYEGNLGANFTAGVKREEAAQYAFNALANVMTVNYSDVFGAYYSGKIFNGNDKFDRDYTLGKQLYNLDKETVPADEFGRLCHTWKQGSKTLTGNYHDAPDAVYTKNVKSSKIYTDLGLTGALTGTSIYIDGKAAAAGETSFAIAKGGTAETKNDFGTGTKTGLGVGNGTNVEVYVHETTNPSTGVTTASANVVVVKNYLGQVKSINSSDKKITLRALSTLPSAGTWNPEFETGAEYEKDEYVMFTIAWNDANSKYEIQSVKPVEKVSGELSAISSSGGYVKFDGEQHDFAETAQNNLTGLTSKDIKGNNVSFSNTYDLIVDANGYAMALVLTEESANDTLGYVYVEKYEGQSGLINGNAAVVEVRYLDGTGTETLPMETKKISGTMHYKFIGDNGIKGDESAPANSANWFPVTNGLVDLTDDGSGTGKQPGKFFGYYLNDDGEIVLKDLEDEVKTFTDTSIDLDGSAQYTSFASESIDLTLNAKTVAHVLDKNDKTSTFTGYKNIKLKDSKAVQGLIVFDGKNSTLVKEMYIMSDASATKVNTFAWFTGNVEDRPDSRIAAQLWINGEKDYYLLDSDMSANTFTNTEGAGKAGVYLVELNDNDVVISVKDALNATVAGDNDYTFKEDYYVTNVDNDDRFLAVSALPGDWDNVTDEKTFAYNEDGVQILNLDKVDGTVGVYSSIDVQNKVTFLMNKDGQVTDIYIKDLK